MKRQTGRQIDREKGLPQWTSIRQTDRQIDRQRQRQTNRQTVIETERHRQREGCIQEKDRQRGRQTDIRL